MKKKNNSGLEVGVGLATMAALMLGTYFMYGKDGVKNRKKVRGWMLKAKGEIVEHVEKMKDVTEENYVATIEKVMAKYILMKHIEKEELIPFIKELKGYWAVVKKQLKTKAKK